MAPKASAGSPKDLTLESLRARIRAIEGSSGEGFGRPLASSGDPAFDQSLPWGGLPLAALHEIAGPCAAGFTAALARRLITHEGAHRGTRGAALVWLEHPGVRRFEGALYGPGLATFGITPGHLVLVRCRHSGEVLWACEEALRSPAVACVVAEIERLDLTRSRRLQLAAEEGGAAGLLLRGAHGDPAPNAALTRWHVRPALAASPAIRWQADLWRCKGGAPSSLWTEWNERTLSFTGTAAPADRAAPPRPAARAV